MRLNVAYEQKRCTRVLRDRVLPYIDTPVGVCAARSMHIPGEPIAPQEFFDRLHRGDVDLVPLHIGDTWGTTWGTTWIEITGQIAEKHRGESPLEIIVDLDWYDGWPGGHFEGMAYRPDGSVIKAVNPRNRWIPLDGKDMDGKPTGEASVIDVDGRFTVYLEASCVPLILGETAYVKTELGEGPTGMPDDPNTLKRLDVCRFDKQVFDYALDLEVVSEVIDETDAKNPRYWKLGKALQRSLNVYDGRNTAGTVSAARRELVGVLSMPAVPSALDNAAMGHSHIDSAWLWPKRETRRKVGRTVSNMLALMNRDPEFLYVMSSAQQYAWLQRDFPGLFDRVLERIREGRFIPVGSMWVESDGMLPTGESLIRQITFGKRYFREQLGVDTEGIWLPDSFGYTGAFPQIARRAGLKWFLTQKISWNDTTKFPHHTFEWQGIDGTPIFTHFPPADTYAAEMTARDLNHSEENYQDKDLSDKAILLFGYGDGGGGATREMLGKQRRMHDLEGVSRTGYQAPNDFFEQAEREMREAAGDDMPTWRGELYLELHRKTLTSQQAMKRGCRQEESMLRIVEYLCAMADLLCPEYAYPTDELDGIWKTLLLNQFHDILPGSAISWVHREAREDYRRDIARLREIADEACAALRGAMPDAPVESRAAIVPSATAGAWHVSPIVPQGAATVAPDADGGFVLDNGLIRAVVDAQGNVVSMTDLDTGREIVPQGMAMGRYELLTDEPYQWDAWDLERDALLTARPFGGNVHVEPIDRAGVAGVLVMRSNERTSIATEITLSAGRRQLDFAAHVDWHEDEKLLKVDVPMALQARYAQFECQYGCIDRPIQKNNEAEEAQFEVCTHRYVRVSDADLTVGVVNASTYGGDVLPVRDAEGNGVGTMVRLTLLAAAEFPDPRTDRGEHDFAWSVVPCGDPSAVLDAAYALNAPELCDVPRFEAPISVHAESGHVVIDWIKLADDDSGDLIVRCYEPNGAPARAALSAGTVVASAMVREVSEMEDAPVPEGLRRALVVDGDGETALDGAVVDLAPFQLATLRIRR
ncbi:alpha-mannosidase [Bifidobacterium pullorum subsp. saeculare]|uniref:alpha-mannosidase n=1 Tax=Bifidobacterium pullorum TaxID=78448 RepID=UPI00195C6086|nr:glycoside hydrolase family 38 C-terminal domain-containing protein [Bifidobacterium pullorum]MBM6695786.1 alpha-mannosidase [Bifidobacterium pullorum subsp. saeculare]